MTVRQRGTSRARLSVWVRPGTAVRGPGRWIGVVGVDSAVTRETRYERGNDEPQAERDRTDLEGRISYRAYGLRRGTGGHLDRPGTGYRTRSRACGMADAAAEPCGTQHQSHLIVREALRCNRIQRAPAVRPT